MTTETFAFALNILWPEEGGFSDKKNDSGGRTMYGVTQVTFDRWRDSQHEPHADVAAITKLEAQNLYLQMFWTEAHCDEMPRRLATFTFDTSVNSGPGEAIKVLQRSVGSTADGQFGPHTVDCINFCTADSAAEDATLKEFAAARASLDAQIIVAHPQDQEFSHGWMNRINALLALLLAANAA
jgi:lysozyme family protein